MKMYRGMFLIILIIFLLGLNTYGWRKSGVNHVLIFELDPRNNLSHEDFIEMAMFFADLWALSILGFIYCNLLSNVSGYISPLVLLINCTLIKEHIFVFLFKVNENDFMQMLDVHMNALLQNVTIMGNQHCFISVGKAE